MKRQKLTTKRKKTFLKRGKTKRCTMTTNYEQTNAQTAQKDQKERDTNAKKVKKGSKETTQSGGSIYS